MSEPRQPDLVQRFVGAAIMAGGALIFAACGLCTLAFVGPSLQNLVHQPAAAPAAIGLVFFLLIGGVPALGGFMLMLLGWRMFSRPPPGPPNPPARTPNE